MKKLILIIFMLIVAMYNTYAQSKVLFISAQELFLFDVKDSIPREIKTNMNITRLYVEDTTLYLVGYIGKKKRRDIHNYYKIKRTTWSTSLPDLLKNYKIDTSQQKIVPESKSGLLRSSQAQRNDTLSATYTNISDWRIKFRINMKLDSMKVENGFLPIQKKNEYLKPLMQVLGVSNIYKNKCTVNVWMLPTENPHNENGQGYLFFCDLIQKKVIKHYPIFFGTLEDMTIVE